MVIYAFPFVFLCSMDREKRGPEQVQSGPDCILHSPLRVKEKRQRRERPEGSSGEAPESDFFLITRKRRQREEGGGQSQPEEPRGGQTTRRDSGEVPEKEPQSRLSRRNRERRVPAGPEQPIRYSPLSVTREREKTEGPRPKLRRGPRV